MTPLTKPTSCQTAKPQDNLRISAAFNLKMGVFTRLAQATYLVNQALKFLSSLPPPGDPKDTVDIAKDTAQLRRTIWALISVTKSEFDAHDLATCCQTAVSYWYVILMWKSMIIVDLCLVPYCYFKMLIGGACVSLQLKTLTNTCLQSRNVSWETWHAWHFVSVKTRKKGCA